MGSDDEGGAGPKPEDLVKRGIEEGEEGDSKSDKREVATPGDEEDDRRDSNGYVFIPERAAPVGRVVYYKVGSDKATAFVQCNNVNHEKCCRWVSLRHVPSRRTLVDWIIAGIDKPDVAEHRKLFYPITKYER